MKVKIGEFDQRWIIHPRSDGDLILTSDTAIAVVNTREKYAVVASSMASLKKRVNKEVRLRQDVVDRLLDGERVTKASVLPVCRVKTPDRVHSMDVESLLVLRGRAAASDTTGLALA